MERNDFKRICLVAVAILLTTGCNQQSDHRSLTEARQGFATKLIRQQNVGLPVAEPPPNLFRVVKYQSPLGGMPAYVSVAPKDGQRHPAIIWIVGGFNNSIGETSWEPAPRENDQSASAFWKAGVVTMYPSLRGGNQNPGSIEAFYGEVDDVLAAADFLSKQDYVDPRRIYLGGHSTGGTMALLLAESSKDRFRAVFAFGPVGNIAGYGQDNLPFNASDRREVEVRSPAKWLDTIRTPTFVFEGAERRSNIGELNSMSRRTRNPAIQFSPVNGANHFSTLAPMTALIAQKILHDDGDSMNITFSDAEITAAIGK